MLTQAQINALIASAGGSSDESAAASARAAQPKAVKTYDFRRPDKFSKDQLRLLQQVHESFGRSAGNRLSAHLRFTAKPLTMVLGEPSQMIFSEYLAGLTLPTQLLPLASPQLTGPMLLDLDLTLARAWVDRWLGGSGEIPSERVEPSVIESALITRLLDELWSELTEAWSSVAEVTVGPHAGLSPVLTPAQLVRFPVSPSDVVAVLQFEVRYDIVRGTDALPIPQSAPMSICIPHSTLEPILGRLSSASWYEKTTKTVDLTGRDDLSATLHNVEVPVTAILGGVELSVDELASLKPGDVIRFAERADHPVRLSVMNQAMAWAVPGKVGDRVALRLLTPLQHLMEA
jgi:flagellar motor switch protein FliM